MMDEANQLAQGCLTAQIDYPLQSGMMVALISDLHKLDPPREMIDHPLVTTGVPPFDGNVMLPARGNDPKWNVPAGDFVNLRVPGFLKR